MTKDIILKHAQKCVADTKQRMAELRSQIGKFGAPLAESILMNGIGKKPAPSKEDWKKINDFCFTLKIENEAISLFREIERKVHKNEEPYELLKLLNEKAEYAKRATIEAIPKINRKSAYRFLLAAAVNPEQIVKLNEFLGDFVAYGQEIEIEKLYRGNEFFRLYYKHRKNQSVGAVFVQATAINEDIASELKIIPYDSAAKIHYSKEDESYYIVKTTYHISLQSREIVLPVYIKNDFVSYCKTNMNIDFGRLSQDLGKPAFSVGRIEIDGYAPNRSEPAAYRFVLVTVLKNGNYQLRSGDSLIINRPKARAIVYCEFGAEGKKLSVELGNGEVIKLDGLQNYY
ncbi:MAG: hypothetical protein N3G80_03795 [Candidatus Micrarchaeota archaeon]|nr:hypothetical protein [Candidatus Micrarchaeota archaeon]